MNPLFSLVRMTTLLLAFVFGGVASAILLGDKPIFLNATLSHQNLLAGWLLLWCSLCLVLVSLRWDCPNMTAEQEKNRKGK